MTPTCGCHGVEMYWNRDKRYSGGGFWRCRIRKKESARRRYREAPEIRLAAQLRNLSRIRVSY
ncbi:MAG TPA: hypothetical protein VFH56_00100 [Acidimicrobiales bacterium]|nr:hypothetical protein [Acidimicrobiales bacterium]